MYSYLNELTLYAGVLYMQPSWYSFSYWPYIDTTPLGHSVTWPRLFFTAEILGLLFLFRICNIANYYVTVNCVFVHSKQTSCAVCLVINNKE